VATQLLHKRIFVAIVTILSSGARRRSHKSSFAVRAGEPISLSSTELAKRVFAHEVKVIAHKRRMSLPVAFSNKGGGFSQVDSDPSLRIPAEEGAGLISGMSIEEALAGLRQLGLDRSSKMSLSRPDSADLPGLQRWQGWKGNEGFLWASAVR
jgi:hypothetical protein